METNSSRNETTKKVMTFCLVHKNSMDGMGRLISDSAFQKIYYQIEEQGLKVNGGKHISSWIDGDNIMCKVEFDEMKPWSFVMPQV